MAVARPDGLGDISGSGPLMPRAENMWSPLTEGPKSSPAASQVRQSPRGECVLLAQEAGGCHLYPSADDPSATPCASVHSTQCRNGFLGLWPGMYRRCGSPLGAVRMVGRHPPQSCMGPRMGTATGCPDSDLPPCPHGSLHDLLAAMLVNVCDAPRAAQ